MRLLTVALMEEGDIVAARQRARQVANLLGFEKQDQTRIATAVSEIARNATCYGGGGRIELAVEKDGSRRLIAVIRDNGPGIADVPAILEGRYKSASGMGVGILGARRLMDDFTLETTPGRGVRVMLAKNLPPGAAALTIARVQEITRQLAASGAPDPIAEVRAQNQELLESLAALKAKQEEAERLNAELESTNKGVVVLYRELDDKARQLADLNAALEERVAAAVAECQQANDTLRQSQKMEAVGQLTGGVAHDFNNLLQIVTGNLETLLRRLPSDNERLRRPAEHAMSGAQRAATLTQRLLAFSRRQPLAPKPLHPNQLIEGLFDLMRRTLGETLSIDMKLANDLWPVEVDANQLENALLNLAVNARDAMPPGGTLTITTANGVIGEGDAEADAAPGQYVSLAVCDTGSGMSDETLARVFEPFFTTKEVGKGTGLGLSMVYGFVKQSGGHLRIESSLGRGTTVSLYLPRLIGVVPKETPAPEPTAELARPGDRILVVEDDPDVRRYSSELLRELGYDVIEAADGEAAMQFIDGGTRIDLLFTDVVLAGRLTGRDVANHCAAVRPQTAILFTTGYARDAIVHNERLDADVELIAKPFSAAALARRVTGLLAAHRRTAQSPAEPILQ